MAGASVTKSTKQGKARQPVAKARAVKSSAIATKRGGARRARPVVVEEVEEIIVQAPEKCEPVRDALYFDSAWYLEHYPDVAEAGVDPVIHYRSSGFREGRQPNAHFNAKAYLEANPDLAGFDDDLFLHYVFFGACEGRPLEP
ncbi:hypothetical protein [Acetobacter sp.]|uniref:hypothetical protein n=1 Tax=Acetobacter sp. TaxID=440 RepID=UPI0039E882DF